MTEATLFEIGVYRVKKKTDEIKLQNIGTYKPHSITVEMCMFQLTKFSSVCVCLQ